MQTNHCTLLPLNAYNLFVFAVAVDVDAVVGVGVVGGLQVGPVSFSRQRSCCSQDLQTSI